MYSKEPNTVKQNEWLLWIAMPFGTIIGAALGGALIGGFFWLSAKFWGSASVDGWFYIYVAPFISSLAFGYLWGYLAGLIAPRGKVVATTVMATLLVLLMIIGVFVVWKSPTIPTGRAIKDTVSFIAVTIAVVIATIHVANEN